MRNVMTPLIDYRISIFDFLNSASNTGFSFFFFVFLLIKTTSILLKSLEAADCFINQEIFKHDDAKKPPSNVRWGSGLHGLLLVGKS